MFYVVILPKLRTQWLKSKEKVETKKSGNRRTDESQNAQTTRGRFTKHRYAFEFIVGQFLWTSTAWKVLENAVTI